MYIVKVLKRKDGASLVLAIVLAYAFLYPLQYIPREWASKLVIETDPGYGVAATDWKETYLLPLLTLAIQLVAIELLLRVAIFMRAGLVRRK